MGIKKNIVEFMDEKLYKPMLRSELAEAFGIEKKEYKTFYQVLETMEKEGTIIRTRSDRYGLPYKMNLVVGVLQGNEKGYGFIVPEDKTIEDIYISAENMNNALHGDKVIARIIKLGKVGRKEEGEIIRILNRANETVVGTFEYNKSFGFVVPDDNRISMDIFIPKSAMMGAKTNQKVVVRVEKWPEKRRSPEGKVVEILGYFDEKGTDVLSVIRQYELPEEFPKKVVNHALSIEQKVSEEEIKNRSDLREEYIFTIDGPDAKDLDDGVSIEKLENGNYLLGVHIADVSHYVKEEQIIDKEAYKRGNSVYFVDRVIPMLPRELSNGICSLNPGENRLAMTVSMEIDKTGEVVQHKILESVINSKARLVYDDISDLLEGKNDKIENENPKLYNDLKLMEELCKILYEKREERGSLDIDFPEARIILDNEGKPIDIVKEDRGIANKIIEEFMLVTNETVAEYLYWSQSPCLYRIHEEPDIEKIKEFSKFVHNFGYSLKGRQEVHPKKLQELMNEIKGNKEEVIISTLLLRSLKKARYSEEQDIHFGLASKFYCHFTAPIRRYSDLQVHRIVKSFINNKMTKKRKSHIEQILPEVAEQTSTMERVAEEVEREVEDLKKAQYMMERIGEVYEGMVSSLTHFGMFIQLDNTVEGLVHFSNMVDDYYYFDEDNYYIIGEGTKKIYRIGDMVKIKVINADLLKRTIDFMLVED